MAAFYHVLSLILMYAGSNLVIVAVPEYSPPQIQVSVLLAASSGVFEESLFFGIPYYLTSNPYAVLIFASVWSFAHIFSTSVFDFNNLAYGSFFFTIPHIFFGLRIWTSGKGWFAIVFHSSWNVSVLITYCGLGIRECAAIGTKDGLMTDILTLVAAISSGLFVWQIYKAKTTQINKPLLIVILVVLAASITYLSIISTSFLF